MKLKVKTLNNIEAEVDVDDGSSVEDLMRAVEASLPNMPSDRQKLIHSGKVLKRELKLSDYNDIKDGDKVIVIASKQPETPQSAPKAAVSSNAPTVSQSTPQPLAQPESQQPLDSAASKLVTGAELETNIARICEMGFPRPMVEQAMAAAFNNPERAVEFLSTGNIPRPSDVFGGRHMPGGESMGNLMGDTSVHDESLMSIQSHPSFQQLRQVIQSDPQMLQQLLETIGQTNPDLLQTIIENQDEFMELLHSRGGNEPYGGSFDGPNVVQLTEAEMEKVQRLEGLGFPRAAVIEAFLACDKNEELAANYLLENAHDFASED